MFLRSRLLLSLVPALAITACSKKATPPPATTPPATTKAPADASAPADTAAPAADSAAAPAPDAAAKPAPDAAMAPAGDAAMANADAAAKPAGDAAMANADAAAKPAGDAAMAPAGDVAAAPPATPPVWSTDGFAAPESVLIVADGYLVSNINGTPFDKDKNGYISKVGADGKVATEKWIDGSKPETELNAPKGMALAGDVLYVADIDTVRMFDAKTGAAKGTVMIPNVTFLNDMAASADGKTVYVSDSAVGPDFKPKGTGAVYAIVDGKATALEIKDVGSPNGVAVDGDVVYVCGIDAAKTIIRFDTKSKAQTTIPVPGGMLDGLAFVMAGDAPWLLVSSWETSSIYKIDKDGKATVLASGIKGPADFAVDAAKKIVVSPAMQDNRISAYNL